MQIKPDEVKEVKVIGRLFGDDVKVIITDGGFNIAMGKKCRNSNKADALAAGSHIALVSYQLEKMHGPDFQPAIFKSESERMPEVEELTQDLPQNAQDAGIELFVLNKSSSLDFVVCKYGLELAKYETQHNGDELVINSYNFRNSISPNKFMADIISKSIKNKVKQLNIKKVVRK